MPIYEYSCADCGVQFERFVRTMTAEVAVSCPECGGTRVKKDWSLFGMGQSGGASDSLAASPAGACSPGGT
jgi:putative FmdB family regulatory protein